MAATAASGRVLVVAPTSHALVFGPLAWETGDRFFHDALSAMEPLVAIEDGKAAEPVATIVAAHRAELHDFLQAVLPAASDGTADPYADLLEPAPDRCARVLVVDDGSLTILSYGAFVLVRMDAEAMPHA